MSNIHNVPPLNATCAMVALEGAITGLRQAARNLLIGAPAEAGRIAGMADAAQKLRDALDADLGARETRGDLESL